jgi:predicted CxxxxCH...CXXCH cytochrome family protein
MADPGHQDTPLPAEVAFDSSVTSDPRQASWDPSAGTCKGVVCHGAANTTPKWTESHQFSCTDCHGGLDNGTGAPPPDLEGNTSISATGVGAHQSHVMTGPLRVGIDCVQCHITPSNVDDPGHIEGGPPFLAEITWGDLASLNTSPVYIQGENPRCSNVYCHGGSFDEDQKGTLTEPTWTTVDGTQAACGTCHKIPPHQPYGSCELCHGSVVSADTTITESGKSLHINGVVDF